MDHDLLQRGSDVAPVMPVGGVPPSPATRNGPFMNHDVRAMMQAYRPTGGVVCGEDLASLLREHTEPPISLLARWIAARQVVSFIWRSQILLPLFQIDLATRSVRPGMQQIISELAAAFSDLELANWFVQPNAWLSGAAPMNKIGLDLPAVLLAARAVGASSKSRPRR